MSRITSETPRSKDVSPTNTTVTSAYASGWLSLEFNCVGIDELALLLTLVKEGTKSLFLKANVDQHDPFVGFEEFVIDSAGEATLDEVELDAAPLTPTHLVKLKWDVKGIGRICFRARRTGAGQDPTLNLSILGA